MNELNYIDVSFCLPCYRVGAYLKDCVDSIVNQPFDGISYEIICVDDCSSDDTYDNLISISNKYPQVRVYQNEVNKGVSYSRNRMIDIARGEYIWFVDPDDMLIHGAVEYVRRAQSLCADALLGNYIRVGEDGSHSFDLSYNDFKNDVIELTADFMPTDAKGTRMSACWAGVFKKDFLSLNKLRFNENMIAQEDTLFYYQFGLRTDKVYKAKTYCYYYRIRQSSVMHSRSDERAKKYYFSMLEMLRVYREHYDSGDYNNKKILKDKILHSRQNVATCLASIRDDAFFKEQLKAIKKQKIYPFWFRPKTLIGREALPVRLLKFLIPIEPMFYFYRYLYLKKNV